MGLAPGLQAGDVPGSAIRRQEATAANRCGHFRGWLRKFLAAFSRAAFQRDRRKENGTRQ
jgi:hypothetical protein